MCADVRPRRPSRAGRAIVTLLTLVVCATTLVGLAPAPAGADPLPPAVPLPIYRHVTDAAGLGDFLHAGFLGDGIGAAALFTEFTGPGACWIDHDNDDDLDLYLVNGIYQSHPEKNALLDPHSMLYRNNGDGTFTDVTAAASARTEGVLQGCAAADYDNDGDQDLFVTGWNGSHLLQNTAGVFADVAAAAGVVDADCGDFACWASSASWFDADRDGCLDLFVSHFTEFDPENPPPFNGPDQGQKNRFFRSLCDGTFSDVTAAAGLDDVKSDTWSAVAADLNNDGWPDLYVSNDGDENDVYLNDGDGTFTRDHDSEAADPDSGMGTAIADFNKDGRLDIVTTNFIGQFNGIYRATAAGYLNIGANEPFTDAFNQSGWATHWFDLDNDARLDLMVVNGNTEDYDVLPVKQPILAYRNLGSGDAFSNVRTAMGTDFTAEYVARGAAWGDYDNDGDIDFLLAEAGEAPTHLFRADGVGNHFLNVDLVGTGPTVTRDAIGARVTVSAAGIADQMQEKVAGSGFLSSNDPRLHFGLAGAQSATVTVRWPDGTVDTHHNVRADSFVRITQGVGIATVRTLPLVEMDTPAAPLKRLVAGHFSLDIALPPGRTVTGVTWDFGDGYAPYSGLETDLFRAFNDVGRFVVRATVTDSTGASRVAWGDVLVWDDLTASVEMEKDVFAPHEPVRGTVTVRFSNGQPVPFADVAILVRHTTGDATLDNRISQLPFFVQQFTGFVPTQVAGTTDAAGVLGFEVPYNVIRVTPLLPIDAHHPGGYLLEATGGARGSTFSVAHGNYAVVTEGL